MRSKTQFDKGERRTERTDGAFSFGARKRTRKGVFPVRRSYERHWPLPGRPVKPARLCAWRTGKSRSQPENEWIHFLAGLLLFLCPEACFPPCRRRILFGFSPNTIAYWSPEVEDLWRRSGGAEPPASLSIVFLPPNSELTKRTVQTFYSTGARYSDRM